MRRYPAIYMTFLLMLFAAFQGFDTECLYAEQFPGHSMEQSAVSGGESPVLVTVAESGNSVALDFSLAGVEKIDMNSSVKWSLSGEGTIGRTGFPDLPAVSRWVLVPDHGKLRLDFSCESRRLEADSPPDRYIDDFEVGGGEKFSGIKLPRIYPPEPVVMTQAMIMRGIRLTLVTVYPVQWDSDAGEYILNEQVNVNIEVQPGVGTNEVDNLPRRPSTQFNRVVDALIVNPPRRDQDSEDDLPGGYLVVANDDYPEAVDDFVNWKSRMGHPTELLTFDPDAVSAIELRAMIREQYEDNAFEYLVFMGSDEADPPLEIPFDDDFYDVYYAQLEGNDILPDVAVGVFNCVEAENLDCAIQRAISYQSSPYMEDDEWFVRAGVAVGACSVPNDLSPSYTGKWVAEVLRRGPFEDIETSFFSDNGVDDPTPMIADLYNDRVNFLLVRAHQANFDEADIERTGVYPFHFLVSSSTIGFGGSGAFNHAFRMGTSDDVRGPSAGFGHYGSPRTNIANALAGGLIEAMFMLDIESYGWARNYAVANLPRVMIADGAERMQDYYFSWRLYGDPGQWCWRGIPKQLETRFDTGVPLPTMDPDGTYMSVTVSDEDDNPVPDAVLCIEQGDDFYHVSKTNLAGTASFTWSSGDLSEDDIDVTITGTNLYPVLDVIEVGEALSFVALEEFQFSDEDGGDGDGIANSGEILIFTVHLANTGEQDMGNLRVELESLSPWVDVSDDGVLIEELNQGERTELVLPAEVFIVENCPDGTTINLSCVIYQAENRMVYRTGLEFTVEAAQMEIVETDIEGNPAPGDRVDFLITLRNSGHKTSDRLTGRLESLSPFITVTGDVGGFNPCEVGDEIEQGGQEFSIVSPESTIPGSIAKFVLILENQVDIVDTLYLSIQIGNAADGDPTGPDNYGYIAIDEEDVDNEWANAPEYRWLNISPWGGDVEGEFLEGMPVNSEDDVTALVELPFAFRFYGEAFNEISVCSNGWLAMGDQTNLMNQQNWQLPGFDGAFGMIAVFWDRLVYEIISDGVFTYYDEEVGAYYIEWDANVEENQNLAPNVFQVVLYDPAEHPTPTGDSPILFQYNTVNNVQDQWEANAGCTVGISSLDGLDGITYTYWDEYPASAARLQEGRAILWTTVRYDEPEEGVISGRIGRFIDDEPVSGARIRTSHGHSTLSGMDGAYVLRNVATGIFDVTFTADGYGRVIEEDVELEADQEIELNTELPHAWFTFDPDTAYIDVEEFVGTFYNVGNAEGRGVISLTAVDTGAWFDLLDIHVDPDEFILEPGDSIDIMLTYDIVGAEIDPGRYQFQLELENDSPISMIIIPMFFVVSESVENGQLSPYFFELSDPYPNPFNATATVEFSLDRPSLVDMKLYDLAGREVSVLASNEYKAGLHRIAFNGNNLSTGLYFVKLEAGEYRSVKRMLLIR